MKLEGLTIEYPIFARLNLFYMWQVVLYSLVIVGIAILLLGIRVFFVKGGKFPNSHIEGNKTLKDKGLCCARRQDSLDRNK